MNAPAIIGFQDEALQLAEEEHFVLSRQLEVMQQDCEYTQRDIDAWMDDEGWEDEPADFYARHRAYFLEQARELYAEGAAQ